MCCLDDRIGSFAVGKEFDAILVQTGQRTTAAAATNGGTERESSIEAEEEKALMGDAEGEDEGLFPSEKESGYNPALIIEAEDDIEKVFEKFIFSVRSLSSPFSCC